MHALNNYRRDNGRYPTQAQGLHALIEKSNTDPIPSVWKEGGYLARLPDDPWGNAYLYLNPGVHGEVEFSAMARTPGKAAKETTPT
ncbi:type II secretion system protein GspG [Paraburkholderia pallida]|uniref:type II secretion system protein GspG n=1 Tax=Paraburkholderia pallida TaxID=2547399 RepID=UPI0026DA0BB8